MKKYIPIALGMVIGATGGFLYWYYIGCASGSCAITSSPLNSSIYGAAMGGMLINLFQKTPTESKQ